MKEYPQQGVRAEQIRPSMRPSLTGRITKTVLFGVFVIWVAGCEHGATSDPMEAFLGSWQLSGGDEDIDCGLGSQHELITNPHQVRFVEGATSDLVLQFFDGEEMTGPVVCEFPYDLGNVQANLSEEHACGSGDQIVTWHYGTAIVSDFGNLLLETHLTDAAGCIVDARPKYIRLPE